MIGPIFSLYYNIQYISNAPITNSSKYKSIMYFLCGDEISFNHLLWSVFQSLLHTKITSFKFMSDLCVQLVYCAYSN